MRQASVLSRAYDAIVVDLVHQMRWSFLPPLMVYFAFGCSTVTAIVGTFFVKEYLDFSAAYIAGLVFWAGLPWALKMPLGHLVDIIWRWKSLLIYLGAGLVATSIAIMYLVLTRTDAMQAVMPIGSWYILSYILAPCGLVLQDAVADAMSIEAVPVHDEHGRAIPEDDIKNMHTTMQTLGRFALISGTVAVALINIWQFSGIEALPQEDKAQIYARIYGLALIIPVISVSGVWLGGFMALRQRRALRAKGLDPDAIPGFEEAPATKPNPWYFIGGGLFVALTLTVGLTGVPYGQEIIFAGSMAIVLFLMRQLIARLPEAQARMLVGTALIIFVFRATPGVGDGLTWFNIDVLKFDQQFLSVLSLITSVLTLAGMLLLRPLIAHRPIATIIVLLTVAAGLLSLPNIGLYYGIHHWTAAMTGGVVDARFIAILDTAVESPLGQIAMIPMLAWIARNAPVDLKATFFAVMASFTNLALSASALSTKYLNEVFIVTREVRADDVITTPADYTQLGHLLLTVAGVTVIVPLLVVFFVQMSRLRTTD
ncbi:hypothetical protein EI983_06335 [Roseovarius faecimaris]|uniref:Folate/biopterin family MFS transporter n=1 Tax=Roseovarius faecimaris TaxID=2494550 RepID=A0A6I6IP77_9RHOB|nr:hypothetical protein [Roseovarius faecimaris]QGX97914.1 hypothetical protein EI983_06335 [Roseovarius faecimaris]